MIVRQRFSRREFLGAASGSALAAGLFGGILPRSLAAVDSDDKPIPRRPLGKTGFQATLFGFGGSPMADLPDDDAAVAVVRRALDLGVNYLDTAPTYHAGRSEERIGRAIKGRRDGLFLATKSFEPRIKDQLTADVESSLRRLGTDRIDLLQIHCVRTKKDLDSVFATGGPLEAAESLKKAGKVRFIGVTGHNDPAVNLEALKRYAFDSMLMPLNCADVHFDSFEKQVLPACVERGIAVIAMKVFAAGKLLSIPGVTVEDCLRYVYSLPISTAVPGCSSIEQVEHDARVTCAFKPLTAAEREALLARTEPHKGHDLEWYKRSAR